MGLFSSVSIPEFSFVASSPEPEQSLSLPLKPCLNVLDTGQRVFRQFILVLYPPVLCKLRAFDPSFQSDDYGVFGRTFPPKIDIKFPRQIDLKTWVNVVDPPSNDLLLGRHFPQATVMSVMHKSLQRDTLLLLICDNSSIRQATPIRESRGMWQ